MKSHSGVPSRATSSSAERKAVSEFHTVTQAMSIPGFSLLPGRAMRYVFLSHCDNRMVGEQELNAGKLISGVINQIREISQ